MEKQLLYSESHEWVKWINENEAFVGLSEYAASQLGDIVYVNIDADEVSVKDVLGDIESVKAVSDFYSPLEGRVVEVNQEIIDNPALINEDSENTWICKISNISNNVKLLSKEEYDAFVKEQ